MNIQRILERLDILFSGQQIDEVEPYLTEQLQLAYEERDYGVCISVMFELIGFFRDTSQYEKALGYCEQVLMLMQQLGYEGTLPYATTCLNVANALRAAGLHKESLKFYESIFPIYREHLLPTDERFAALFNNMSLLYQEMGDFESAVDCLHQALDIVVQGDDEIKVAITHSNLGASLLQLGEVEEALEHLDAALAIFNKSEEKDFHYNAAVAAMGQAYAALSQFENARECFLEALYEQMKHCGKSEAFYRILENLHSVEARLGVAPTEEPEDIARLENAQKPHIHGLDISAQFYESIGHDGLFRAFPGLADKMAIGLAGEGSECYGFDDAISTDHDFGPGFCIWLSKEDYDVYGAKLQAFYDTLPDTFMGHTRHTVNSDGRVGVWCMDDFFRQYTGYAAVDEIVNPHKPGNVVSNYDAAHYESARNEVYNDLGNIAKQILTIPEEGMSVILNGRIFHDPSGVFTARRKAFYDAFTEEIWQMKMAKALIELGKYGQYNYPRSMKRGDYVTAQIVLYKYIETLLKFVHYVNHAFPPYYKCLKKSASGLDKLAVLADLTEALADFADGRSAWAEDPSGATDKIVGTVEIIASLIIDECRKDGLFDGLDIPDDELFLETYGKALYAKIADDATLSRQVATDGADSGNQIFGKAACDDEAITARHTRKLSPLSDEITLANNSFTELVDYIVSLEWQAFDAVQNQGGRADCQDDWGTFSIMRKSQYLTWPKELIISFIQDFRSANNAGWNLITEKYGRMMKTTDPKAFEEIRDKLPALTETQESIIEQIVQLQVSWMEDFAKKYPNMAANSRSIHTSEDNPFNTSYETYLRGELSTYSHETLKGYGAFIVGLVKSGKNLAKLIMENTAKLYGYASLEDAEQCLGQY